MSEILEKARKNVFNLITIITVTASMLGAWWTLQGNVRGIQATQKNIQEKQIEQKGAINKQTEILWKILSHLELSTQDQKNKSDATLQTIRELNSAIQQLNQTLILRAR